MAQTNPFAQYGYAETAAAPPVIYGPPKTVDPAEEARLAIARSAESRQQLKDDDDRNLEPLRRRKLLAETIKAETEAAGSNRAGKLDSLSKQLDRVQELYEQGYEGGPSFSSLLEYLPGTSGNQQFNSASAGLSEQALSAFRVPGVGTQSDRELASFIAANRPQASDSDLAIEEKLANLRNRIDAERASVGSKPWAWRDSKASAPVAKEAKALTVDNVADFAAGLSGGKYDFNADGDLTYNGQIVPFDKIPDAVANSDQFRGAYKAKFGNYPPIQVTVSGGAPSANALDTRRNGVRGSVDSVVRGAADAVTLGTSDELEAGLETLIGNGSFADNLRNQRAIDAADQRVNPVLRFTGQALGGMALPLGQSRSALSLGMKGAGYGGAYATGSSEGSLAERVAAAPVGAALGGALGAAGGALTARLSRNLGKPLPPNGGAQNAIDVAQAGRAEGVRLSRPIVDPGKRDAMAFLDSSLGSGNVVRQALKGTADDIERSASALTNRAPSAQALVGTGRQPVAQESGMMGQRIQDAGERYIKRSGNIGRRLYDRAASSAADNRVEGKEAVKVLDEQIADLSRNAKANAPLIGYLNDVRADFVDDAGKLIAKDVGAIRELRTSLRGQVSARNLTASDAERRVGMVLDAARTDIQRDLGASAPDAVRLYGRADKFWRERKAEIDGVVRRVIGNNNDRLSGEQVWTRVRNMAGPKGDSGRLSRVWAKLDNEEQADAAASIAETLGRRSADEEFSPALFVSSVRGLSPSARRTIFGPEGAKSIENLRLLSEAYRDTHARLNNTRSGQVLQWGSALKDIALKGGLGGVAGAAVAGPVGGFAGAAALAGAGALGRNLSARALMSPDMSRWLVASARASTPQQINRAVERLSQVATRDPAIAQEALGLQRHLMEAFGQAPLKAAAEDRSTRNAGEEK